MVNGDRGEPLAAPLFRKYIAYAREYVHPKLDSQAKKDLMNFYIELRKKHTNDSTPITPRQLESLVRLTQVTFISFHLNRLKKDFKLTKDCLGGRK